MAVLRHEGGCEFCIDAPAAEFDHCRVCGRGEPVESSPVEPMMGLRLAVRIAKGGPLSIDGPAEREAFYAALRNRKRAS
jgi:hypothetical protein